MPLADAVGAAGWIGPTLGFVVVVASGLERIFGRTTPAAPAQGALRRGLARERRLFLAGAGPYDTEGGFDLYAQRSEELIAVYDQAMLDYSSTLARRSD